jgi:hypothetical protein
MRESFYLSMCKTEVFFTLLLLLLPLSLSSLIGCLEHSKSQYGEEGILQKTFFRGVHNGTYVELGAANGVKYSNTIYLAAYWNWNGVLIEASRWNYKSLQSRAN